MRKVKRMTYIFPSAVAGTASVIWVSLDFKLKGLLDGFEEYFGEMIFTVEARKRGRRSEKPNRGGDGCRLGGQVTETTKDLFDSPRNYRLLLFLPLSIAFIGLIVDPQTRTRLELSSCSFIHPVARKSRTHNFAPKSCPTCEKLKATYSTHSTTIRPW